MAVTERLELDLSAALSSIGRIDDSLSRTAREFKVSLASALDVLSGVRVEAVDARAVTTAIDEAVKDADLQPEVTADADPVTEAIDEAVASADTEAEVGADASAVTDEIDSAVAAAEAEAPITADTGDMVGEIESAAADADVVVPVEADTSQAEQSIQSLGETAGEAGAGFGSLEGGVGRAGGAAAVATGEFSGLKDILGNSPGVIAGVAGGIGVLAGVTKEFFSAALESDTADRRFAQGLGDTATAVSRVDVGNLAEDLSQLALRTGNSDEALKLAAARLGDLGRAAGGADSDITEATESILALSIRATTLNPTLGQAGDVADALSNALARGGKALNNYGLSISSAEINARALEQTGKSNVAELSQFEKTAAGASIAVGQLGTHLKQDIDAGAQGAEVRLRSLRERVGELAERLGQPLLEPVLAAFTEAQPIIEDVGEGFGELAKVAVPLLIETLQALQPVTGTSTELLKALSPVLHLIVDLIDAIPGPALSAAAAFLTVNKALGGLSGLLSQGGLNSQILGGGLAALTPITAGLAAVTIAVTSSIADNNRKKQEARKAALDLAAALLDETAARGDALVGITREQVEHQKLGDELQRIGITYEQLTNAAIGDTAAVQDLDTALQKGRASGELTRGGFEGLVLTAQTLRDRFQDAAKAAIEDAVGKGKVTAAAATAAEKTQRLKDGTIDYFAALQGLLPEQANLIVKHGDAATAAGRQADEEKRLTDEINKQIDALLSLIDKDLASERAKLRLRESVASVDEAQQALTKAIKESGKSSDEAAQAQRRLDSAQLSEREAAIGAAKAQADLANEQVHTGNEAEDAKQKQENLRQAFHNVALTLAPGSPLRIELERYANQLGAVPGTVNTVVTADTSQAVAAISDLHARINAIRSADVTVSATTAFHEASLEGRMAGGPTPEGEVFFVGERGPELFVGPRGGGQILSNADTRALLAAERFDGPALADRLASLEAAIERLAGSGRPAASIGPVIVNEVASDPRATAFAVSTRLGMDAER